MSRSNAHRLQITRNCDSHFGSPVLDWTVRSSPNFLKTGLDCGPEVPDRTVWSFLQSPFPCLRPDHRIGTGPCILGPDCGPNSLDHAVRLFPTVSKKGHGPDRTGPWPVYFRDHRGLPILCKLWIQPSTRSRAIFSLPPEPDNCPESPVLQSQHCASA